MENQYFRLVSTRKGHHYFKVNGVNQDVVKITFGNQPKKGRPFCPGITLIKYTTFISSYGWNYEGRASSNPKSQTDLTEISSTEFNKAKDIILKQF